MVGGLDDQWVADLIEVQPLAKYNKGIRYLLTVIDVLSKYAWVQPLKNKTGPSVVEALETIVDEGRKPVRLQTDKGKEFYNKTVQDWFKEQGIQHFSTEGDAKASVVERFNRTIKQRLYRYFTAANTLEFDSQLQALGLGIMRHLIRVLVWYPNKSPGKMNQPCGNDCMANPKRRNVDPP